MDNKTSGGERLNSVTSVKEFKQNSVSSTKSINISTKSISRLYKANDSLIELREKHNKSKKNKEPVRQNPPFRFRFW